MSTAGPWTDINTIVPDAISDETLSAIQTTFHFDAMTPVQRAVIPLLLSNKDTAVEAATGSGKTLAYVVPALEFVKKFGIDAKVPIVIILVPTRELAQQVYQVISQFIPALPYIRPQVVTSGYAASEDVETFNANPANIIIGTPGKLNDFMDTLGRTSFNKVELFVIDEADRILKMGFEAHVTATISILPRQRRTGIFSATLTPSINEIIKTGMRYPKFIRVNKDTPTPEELTNFYAMVDPHQKYAQLVEFLRKQPSKTIVFVLTTFFTDYMKEILSISMPDRHIYKLHGKLEVQEREQNLQQFREDKEHPILVATDVAARGIDIPNIEWIVQFDAPQLPDQFIHRVGRTARIGQEGQALILLRPHEDAYYDFMVGKKIELVEMDLPIPDDHTSLLTKIREIMANSDDLYQLAKVALTSYVQAYSKHQLRFLLRKKELDIIALADSIGLVRLPGMPELKDKRAEADAYNEQFLQYNAKYAEQDRLKALARQEEMKKEQKMNAKSKRWDEEISGKKKKINKKGKK